MAYCNERPGARERGRCRMRVRARVRATVRWCTEGTGRLCVEI